MNLKYELKKLIPDDLYLKIKYKKIMKKTLKLHPPKTFNEKLQWLKIHDRNPEYVKLVDKYEVKKIVSNIIGDNYVIPTLGIWNSFDEINFELLPDQFVLKCTHDSGSLVICKDKKMLDLEKCRKEIEAGLKLNYYWTGREWPYKMIKPRIIAEQYMEDKSTKSLEDYKLFCFNGIVDNIMVVRGRSEGKPKFYHFDKDWNLCRFNRLTRSLPEEYFESKPIFIDEMIRIAEKLSEKMIHVRIDLYEANGKIYFGEYTLYNQSGWESGFDEYSDNYLGSLIKLPYEKRG